MNKYSINLRHISFGSTNDTQVDNPNWLSFKGVCLFTDVCSDGIPCGLDCGVMFPSDVVNKHCNSLVNMGVNVSVPDEWDYGEYSMEKIFSHHDITNKIGVITKSYMQGNQLWIEGGIWQNDFPAVADVYNRAKKSLGFSVEVLLDGDVEEGIFKVKDLCFTGVSMLFADLACYKDTFISAQNKLKNKEQNNMDEKKLQSMFEALTKSVSNSIESVKTELSNQMTQNQKEVSELQNKFNEYVTAENARKEEEKKSQLEAQKKAEEVEKAKKAELEAKKKAEEEKRKSAVAYVFQRFENSNATEFENIMRDDKLTPSEKFHKSLGLASK